MCVNKEIYIRKRYPIKTDCDLSNFLSAVALLISPNRLVVWVVEIQFGTID